MKKHHFYEGMVPMPGDFDTLQSNAEEALRESSAALAGVGVLEGLKLSLDGTGKNLRVNAGKALLKNGQLLNLEQQVALKLTDPHATQVVLRYESEEVGSATTLRGESTWQQRHDQTTAQVVKPGEVGTDELVLGEVKPDPQDATKYLLDESKRVVAKGWEALTQAPFEVKSPVLTLNADEAGAGLTTTAAHMPHIKRTKKDYTAPFSARHAHACAVFRPKGSSTPRLWLIGGRDGNNKNDVWSTADGVGWTQHQNAPFAGRSGHQAVAFQDKLWVLGGYTGNYSNEVWWSEDGENWTQENATPRFSARHSHACAVFKAKGDSTEKLWLIGGDGGSLKKDVWSFDGNVWKNHGDGAFPARYSHQLLAFGGRLWLLAGNSDKSGLADDVWWSEDGVIWHEAPKPAFSPRRSHRATVHDGRMWVVGGSDGKYLNDVWSSADGYHWRAETHLADFSPRRYHAAVAFKNRLWVIAGYTKNGRVADLWTSENGEDWRNYAVEETLINKEKKAAGLRVQRGSAGQSVLAYSEESGQWEIDGRGIATNEAEVHDALSLNKHRLDALRTQLLDEIKATKAEAAQAVQQARKDAVDGAVPVGFVYIQYPWELPPQSGNFIYSYMYNNRHNYTVSSNTSSNISSVFYINSSGGASSKSFDSTDIEKVELRDGSFITMHGSQVKNFLLGEVKLYHLKAGKEFTAYTHEGKSETRSSFATCETHGYVLGYDFYRCSTKQVSGASLHYPGRWVVFQPYQNNGAFFRSEGGNATSFEGGLQEDAGRNAKGRVGGFIGGDHTSYPFYVVSSEVGPDGLSGNWNKQVNMDLERSWGSTHTANEFRPRNYTMRMWKRVA